MTKNGILDGVEFASFDDLVGSNPLTKRQRIEQQEYLEETRRNLEAQRNRFDQQLEQVRRDHLDKLIDGALAYGFEEREGGASAHLRHKLQVVTRRTNHYPADVEQALASARSKAGDSGKTPALLWACYGPVRDSGKESAIERVVMVVDLGDLAPADD